MGVKANVRNNFHQKLCLPKFDTHNSHPTVPYSEERQETEHLYFFTEVKNILSNMYTNLIRYFRHVYKLEKSESCLFNFKETRLK